MDKNLLKQAADELKRLTAELAAKTAECETEKAEKVKLAQHIESVKTAADNTISQTEKAKADVGALAKQAADELLDRGMISNRERADRFAAELTNSHVFAIKAVKQAAERISSSPKLAETVPSSEKPLTSDQVWANHAARYVSG